MINLNLYDDVIERNKNWIDPKYKTFYSRTIGFRPFFTILKRYNKSDNSNHYYLVLSDELIEGHTWFGVNDTGRGYLKMKLDKFWDLLQLKITSVTEVIVVLEDEADNATVYYLDI